jgi:sugar/nucleoside kinase (ribokinase family)
MEAFHDTIVVVRLVTLGDLLLDVVVRLERPPVLGDDTAAETRVAPGGQAANVAAWAAELGAVARVVARRGDDPAGELLTRSLAALGVEVVGPVGGRTGIVVSLAAAGDRTMASDRGCAADLRPQDLDPAWFDCDVLHVSGYALALEPAAGAAAAAAALARERGALVSLDVAAATVAADVRRRAAALSPDVVFATARERDAFGSFEARWVVKRGPAGFSADGRDWPAPTGEVVDTTGAGDALAAGFLVGGPELALQAAARCCARVGAQP